MCSSGWNQMELRSFVPDWLKKWAVGIRMTYMPSCDLRVVRVVDLWLKSILAPNFLNRDMRHRKLCPLRARREANWPIFLSFVWWYFSELPSPVSYNSCDTWESSHRMFPPLMSGNQYNLSVRTRSHWAKSTSLSDRFFWISVEFSLNGTGIHWIQRIQGIW